MKEGYIYKITNLITGQIYIGQAVNAHKRKNRYRTLDCKDQKFIYISIKHYGWEKHKFEVIYKTVCTKEQLDSLEISFIKEYNSYYYDNNKYGLNLTRGGKTHDHLKNQVVIDKIQKSRKGYTHSEETKKKISEANKGQIPWCKGKKFSKEHIAKIVETKRKSGCFDNRKCSEETKKKLSLSMKGRIFTEEHRKNISESAKHRKNKS